MARGFESKDVEFQQAEAGRARSLKRTMSPAVREADAKRRTIELALARARAERAAAINPRHRQMLDHAIRSLEETLAATAEP
jgi:hypothetical protein